MGIYGSAPKPPDYTPLAQAQIETSQQMMDYMNRTFDEAMVQNDRMYALTKEVTDVQLQTAQEQADFASRERQRYERDFIPMEDQFRKEALAYDTDARRQAEAGAAMADVGAAVGAGRDAAARQLASYGVDPSMLRSGALDLESRVQEGGMKAAAGTNASRVVEETGRNMRASAINLGRGLPATSTTSAQTSTGAGAAAAGAGQGAVGTGMGSYGAATGFGAGATAATAGAVDALNSGYNTALGAYEANQSYGPAGLLKTITGGIAGAATGMFFNDGGPILPEHSPSRGAVPDDVKINVSADEFIVPAEVVRWKGQEFFEKLKTQVAKAKQQPAGAMST